MDWQSIVWWICGIVSASAVAVFILELWLTKLRAARYAKTLHEIAHGNFATEYNDVRAQRDRYVKIARETLDASW